MKCALCQFDNKDDAGTCRKCGADLRLEPLWKPDWRWHARALAVIYVSLTVLYFVISHFLSRVPEPYRLRDIPKDITPWISR